MSHSALPSITKRADFYDLEYAAKLGSYLPAASAKALEQIIPLNPNDVISRARLMGYYWARNSGSTDGLNADQLQSRCDQTLWFIRNAPDCVFLGDNYFACDPVSDKSHYDIVKAAWNEQLKLRPLCAQSKVNFALFLFDHEKQHAANLLNEVLILEPLNEWALSLLPMLGHAVDNMIPQNVEESIMKVPASLLDDRLKLTEKMLRQCPRVSFVTNDAIETDERILEKDPLALWARMEILHWCEQNLQRSNRLSIDPKIGQRWYRHACWILSNVPHLRSSFPYSDGLGLGVNVPANFFEPIRDLFIAAINRSHDKNQVLNNSLPFFLANLSEEATKKLVISLDGYKQLGRASKQRLLREMVRARRYKHILELELNLDDYSSFTESTMSEPPALISEFSSWIDDLDLKDAYFEGGHYTEECGSLLESSIENFSEDLLNTARLVGFYNRKLSAQKLTPSRVEKLQEILLWFIEHAPESVTTINIQIFAEESDIFSADRIRTAWEKQVATAPENRVIALNAARWCKYIDPSYSSKQANKVLEKFPGDVAANQLLYELAGGPRFIGKNFQDVEFENNCQLRLEKFNSVDNKGLAELCDKLSFHTFTILDCLRISGLAAWTNEQVLKKNPNDAILRGELLKWYELEHVFFCAHDAEVARKRTEHILWMLENIPKADLYFFTRIHDVEGIPTHKRIIEKAVRKQRKVHGPDVARYRPEFPRNKTKGS